MLDNGNETIFIGKKPLMTYVNSAIIQLASLPTVTLKARGLSIGSAVSVAQIIIRRTNIYEINKIKIDSESLDSLDGRKKDVSTIEIPISRIKQ